MTQPPSGRETTSGDADQGPGDRYYGVYRALVLDTSDPLQVGRVRVRIPAVTGETESGWVPVAASAPHAGYTVVVAFEEGDLDLPIVIGTLWNGRDAPPSASGRDG